MVFFTMVLLSAKTDSVSNLSNNTGSRNLRIVAHRADIQRFVFNPIDADGWKETIILFQLINVMINCCINVAEFVTVIWHADKKVIGTKVSGDVVIFLVKASKIGSNFQKQIITAVLPIPVIE